MGRLFNHWDIAYCVKGQPFRLITPPPYGWTADPFLVAYQGEIYLFAEIFLYKTERNGVIGYSKFADGVFGPWTVSMDKHWHLSYPNVYVRNKHLYMVPESYQAEEVAEYELQHFPAAWRKQRVILANGEFCDSTFFTYAGREYMLTFKRGQPSPAGEGWIFRMQDGQAVQGRKFSTALFGARCGGKVLQRDGQYIRVAQNCESGYGSGLIFYAIDSVEPEYREHVIDEWQVKDINPAWQDKYTGIHTYNALGELEVVDLQYATTSPEEEEASHRAHLMFVDKYR